MLKVKCLNSMRRKLKKFLQVSWKCLERRRRSKSLILMTKNLPLSRLNCLQGRRALSIMRWWTHKTQSLNMLINTSNNNNNSKTWSLQQIRISMKLEQQGIRTMLGPKQCKLHLLNLVKDNLNRHNIQLQLRRRSHLHLFLPAQWRLKSQ